jgi:hypothetical protein
MIRVAYTHHARVKFDLLEQHGFVVTPEQVEDTVLNPEKVTPQPGGRWIAQKGITEQHLLRVVYRQEGDRRVVITFYPGRRQRYEGQL